MGVFESKIKEMPLMKAFGQFPTGINEENASELWKRYDENNDGSLDMKEAKHMVIDLAEQTVNWAKSNIEKIMEEVTQDGDAEDMTGAKQREEMQQMIEQAYKLMKDDEVIDQILKDFDTDGDGTVSKEEFIAKATEGYDILRPTKKAKTLALRVHSTIEVNGHSMDVHKETVGPSVYVSISGFFPDPQPPFCLATIGPNKTVNVAGQLGKPPGTGKVVSGGVGPETTQCLENIKLILKACGCSLEHLLKVNIYLKDNDGNAEPGGRFHEMNQAYRTFFGDIDSHHLPARITVGCGTLAGGAQVEIDCQATL